MFNDDSGDVAHVHRKIIVLKRFVRKISKSVRWRAINRGYAPKNHPKCIIIKQKKENSRQDEAKKYKETEQVRSRAATTT